LIAASFDRDDAGLFVSTDIEIVRERVRTISKVFKHEFRFRADAPFEDIFEETLAALERDGHLQRENDQVAPGAGQFEWSGDHWLRTYSSILTAFFEGYMVAAHSLERLFSGPRTEKDLVKGGLALGQSLYLADELTRRESISKPLLLNAYQSFTELGYLRMRMGKIEVQEAYTSRDALDELRATLKGYVTGRHPSHQ
jgi:glycerol-3-phosphate O-acyltransferase